MRLEELVNENRENLNQTDLMIWKFIFNHRKKSAQMSVHELAKCCAVSSATLVRFAKKLGLHGFGELKAAINFEKNLPVDYKDDVINDLRKFYDRTIENLTNRDYESAIKLLYNARRIFAFPTGYVQRNALQEMKRIFLEDNVFIYEIIGSGELDSVIDFLTEDDVFIFISLSGESPVVVEFAQRLKDKGVPSISITRLSENTLASLSTVNLYISPAKFKIPGEAQFKTFMPFFSIVEVLYLKYRIFVQQQEENI